MNSVTIENNKVVIANSSSHSIVDKRKKELYRLCKKFAPIDSFAPITGSIFSYNFSSIDDVYFTVYILSNQLNFEVEVKYKSTVDNQKKITFRCKNEDCCTFFVKAYEEGGNVQVSYHKHSHPLNRMKNCQIINTLTDEIMNHVHQKL